MLADHLIYSMTIPLNVVRFLADVATVPFILNAASQCRINAGAIDAAAYKPIEETGPRPRTRKEKSSLDFGCDFSGWYNFGKNSKIVATRCRILKVECTKLEFGWLHPRPRSENLLRSL